MKLTMYIKPCKIMNKGIVNYYVQMDESAPDPLLTTGSLVRIRAGELISPVSPMAIPGLFLR